MEIEPMQLSQLEKEGIIQSIRASYLPLLNDWHLELLMEINQP
jgi:hypothetical protein